MYKLFNDKDVVLYIEGIKWFNSDIDSTRMFIDSMNKNFQKGQGVLWCILYENHPIGIIMVNDLNEDPFCTFALFPPYRGFELMKECVTEINKYLLDLIHETPTISSLESNISALKLMQKLPMLHQDKNYKV